MAHAPQVEAAAAEVRKTFWQKHGIQRPWEFLGFCLSLLPIPGIQQAGQALEKHVSDKSAAEEVGRLWSAIAAINPSLARIDDIEAAIAEIAKTVEGHAALQTQVQAFLGKVQDSQAGFRLLTDDHSLQTLTNSVVVAERAVVEATNRSSNVLQGVDFQSPNTLLNATGGSSNYINNSTFRGPAGAVGMQGIVTRGSLGVSGSGVSFTDGSSIEFREGSTLSMGGPRMQLAETLTCPKCRKPHQRNVSALVPGTFLFCPHCGHMARLP